MPPWEEEGRTYYLLTSPWVICYFQPKMLFSAMVAKPSSPSPSLFRLCVISPKLSSRARKVAGKINMYTTRTHQLVKKNRKYKALLSPAPWRTPALLLGLPGILATGVNYAVKVVVGRVSWQCRVAFHSSFLLQRWADDALTAWDAAVAASAQSSEKRTSMPCTSHTDHSSFVWGMRDCHPNPWEVAQEETV